MQAIFDIVQEIKQEKSDISISQVDIPTWLRVESRVGLKYDIVEDLKVIAKKKGPPFKWHTSTERAQSERLTTAYGFSAVEPFGDAYLTAVAGHAEYCAI